MAGGKETPRQKMIGMMYLVLTALLALNVSKQIVAAFVTINDKLDNSAKIINDKNHNAYSGFEKKYITDKAQGGDGKLVKFWQEKADLVAYETAAVVDFLLVQSNRMIEMAEKKSWLVEESKVEINGESFYTELEPLSEISQMDNYDIPTNLFIGGNPEQPVEDGLAIRNRVIEYRNKVLEIMATYDDPNNPKNKYSFTSPESVEGLPEAMASANPDDTAMLANFYKALNIEEEITQTIHGEEITHPWPSAMFDHAPIVAAAAIFTALKLDVRNAESMAYDFLLSKVDVQEFDFNKIEPMAMAPAAYINQGDSLPLFVQIAAYDSTATPKIKYGVDADTVPENWKDATGTIGIRGDKPGPHKVKGVIYVKQRGVEIPKPWEFSYTVGQPMGVVSLPDLNVLYKGYDNKVMGTASGFPPDKISLSGSGCSISKQGNFYIAKPTGNGRTAFISVNGKKDDGSSVNLGKFEFRVLPLPKPSIYLGSTEDGSNIAANVLRAQTRLFAKYPPEVPLNVSFSVTKWTLNLTGAPREVSGNGSTLSSEATSMLRNARSGNTVSFMCTVKFPDGSTKRKGATFKVS